MLQMDEILLKTFLLVVLSISAVVSIFDPSYTEKTKSYRLDPYIARELQRTSHHNHHHEGILSHRSQSNPRLSSFARYQSTSGNTDPLNIEQQQEQEQERHANHDRKDYANNLDEYYGGCPSGYTGLLPYPYDCRRFVNCWKGRAYIQTCGPGTVFNGDTLECDNPNKVVCKGLNAKAFDQQPSTITNNRLGRLQQQNNENDNDEVVSCPTGYTGLLPHPRDCSKFLNCASGTMHIQTCGPQTMFNPRMKVCDFTSKVDCTGRGGGGGESSSVEPSWSGNRDGKNFETTSTRNQLTQPQRKGWPQNHSHNHHHHHHHHEHGFHHHPGFHGQDYPSSSTIKGGSFVHNHHNHNCTDRSHNYHHPVPTTPDIQVPLFNRNRWTSMNRTRPAAPTTKTTTVPSNSWSQQPPRWRPVPQEPIPSNRPNPTVPTTSWTPQPPSWRPVPEEPSKGPTPQPSLWGPIPEEPPRAPTQPDWFNRGNSGLQTTTTTATPSSNYPNIYYGSTPSTPGTDTDTDTTIYYAQPVDDDQPSEEVFTNLVGADISQITLPANRRNHSRGVNLPTPDPTMDVINIPNQNLMPPHRSFPSDERQFQAPGQDSYQPTFPQVPLGPSPTPPSSRDSVFIPSSSYQPPSEDDGQFQIPEQFAPVQPRPSPSQPSNRGRFPIYDINVRNNFPVEETTPRTDDTYPDYSAQYPSFTLPNSRPGSRDSTVQPSSGSDQPTWLKPRPPQSSYSPNQGAAVNPTPQSSYSPNQGGVNPTPISGQNPWIKFDESNLYGGMLPPLPPGSNPQRPLPTPSTTTTTTPETLIGIPLTTNVRVFEKYPPPGVQNATTKIHPNPFYSPSYSGVAHSRNTSWPSIKTSPPNRSSTPPSWGSYPTQSRGSTPPPNRNTLPSTFRTTTSEPDFEPDIVFSHDGGPVVASRHQSSPTTTQRFGLSPPSYNREFYKPTTPMSVNRSRLLETEQQPDDQTNQMPISEAIKLLLRPYINRSGTVTDDMVSKAESHIMNLSNSADPTTSTKITTTTTTTATPADAVPKDVEIVFAGEQNSLSPTYVPPPPLPSSPSPSSSSSSTQYHERHNRHFHQMHPHLPNPFGNELGEGDIVQSSNVDVDGAPTTLIPAETSPAGTSPENDNRLGSDDLCEFDCGNGQCVKTFETCNGINNCGNRKDEEQCGHLGYEIRLSNEGYGRVEVKILGQWGYVCDDKFGIVDANVVCRELGYQLGASEVHGNSFYPPADVGEISFFMDEVDCLGNETSLKDCQFKGWGMSDCGPDEIVGVQCKTPVMTCPNDYWLCSSSKECIPPAFVCDNVADCSDKSDESTAVCNSTVEFRLRGGNVKHEGRLEVLYRGVWGTVCDDDFGPTEAQVACNSLGYYGPAKIAKNAYGPGIGPIWLDQLSCYGNETTLDMCNHWSWGEHNCNHTEDVSLNCTPGQAPTNTKPTTKSSQSSDEDLQTTDIYDIGLDLYPMERHSKSAKTTRKTCGHFNPNLTDEIPKELERVIKGNIAKRGHHPWQATIRTKGRGDMSSHWCGAVLISKKHLLTAAHCLVGYPKGAYFIRLGDHYANIAESSEIDSFIENWYIHEKFREGTHMNNDIAVIVMKNPVRFNDYIQPICLPQEGTEYKEGRRCTISGWGSIQSGVSTPSNNLRVAEIPVISDEICKLPHVYGSSVTEGMFCAGFLEEGVDACEGDSGGPFVCSDSDSETLYGIISWGQQCGHANKPGVYVKVEKYLDWIYEKIRFSMQKDD